MIMNKFKTEVDIKVRKNVVFHNQKRKTFLMIYDKKLFSFKCRSCPNKHGNYNQFCCNLIIVEYMDKFLNNSDNFDVARMVDP